VRGQESISNLNKLKSSWHKMHKFSVMSHFQKLFEGFRLNFKLYKGVNTHALYSGHIYTRYYKSRHQVAYSVEKVTLNTIRNISPHHMHRI